MSQTADVDTEPLTWPIAPDGYIPNSVIRSWRRKGRDLGRTDSILGLHWVDERNTTNAKISSIISNEEEEEVNAAEMTIMRWDKEENNRKEKDQADRKREEDKKKEKEDEKNIHKGEKMQVEGKERTEEEKVTGDKTDKFVTLKQSYGLQTQTMKKQKTLDEINVVPQKPEAKSRYSTKNVDNMPLPSCDENGHKPLTESNEFKDIYKTFTPAPPLHHIPPKDGLEPPVKSPVVSATPKQEQPQHRVPPPLTAPPPSPEYPQPQSVLGHPESSPVEDQKFLLSSAKYVNIQKQVQVTLDQKVLDLYKKFKLCKKKSQNTGMSFIASGGATRKATHSTIQNNTLEMSLNSSQFHPQACSGSHYSEGLKLNSGLGSPSPFTTSTIQTQPHSSIRAAKLPTTENSVKSSNVTQLVATIPSLQTGQGATHQRVVQKIQMKGNLEPASGNFCHVIPMASQQTFFTLNTCGETQYGRLHFDWMRGSEEEKLLNVSLVKPKNCRWIVHAAIK